MAALCAAPTIGANVSNPPPNATTTPEQAALIQALRSVLEPLAVLAVAKGLTYQVLDDVLKQALVNAAHDAHPGVAAHRRVSRISTTTGIHRREVTRLTQAGDKAAPPRASLASGVYAHWLTSPAFCERRGRRSGAPKALPRQGPHPSFETLARAITSDVHPRTLLEEVIRLGYAALDPNTDTVSLVADAAVPRGDAARMLRILGSNVGDHFRGTVANVLGDGRQHFDQALFADEMSDESITAVRKLITEQWRELYGRLWPQIERLFADDAAHPQRVLNQRLRIGIYSFNEPVSAPTAQDTEPD
jgi:Family of unknown function (DUF6502)